MSSAPSPLIRGAAAAISALALGSLAIRFAVERAEIGDPGGWATIWSMARYFTHLTNLIVGLVFGVVALAGRWPGAGLPAASVVWIAVTGAVYHLLLSATHHPEGIDVLANIGQHTAVPVAASALWLAAAPKAGLGFRAPVLWTAWPLGYAGYALLRGAADGRYPYFFLDPVRTGPAAVAAWVGALGLLFLVLGWALVALARRAPPRPQGIAP